MGTSIKGLELSRRLFEQRGHPLLQQLDLLNVCAVGCFGGTSQNANLDDDWSRDHMWGPYLTFVLKGEAYNEHASALEQAIAKMPDEIDGVHWIGYDGPEPRRTGVQEAHSLLRLITGLDGPVASEGDWIPLIERNGFLGRRWTEQLFDAGQGAVFHGTWFEEMWRDWTKFVPINVKLALISRSVFRIWNAGPTYNLNRLIARKDAIGTLLCTSRFVDEVMELGFTLSDEFTPAFKWRSAHFQRFSVFSKETKTTIARLVEVKDVEEILSIARSIESEIKSILRSMFSVRCGQRTDLSMYAHAIKRKIRNKRVKDMTNLDWWVHLG